MRLLVQSSWCLFFSLVASASPAFADDSLLTHGADFARVSPAQWVAEGWRVSNPDPGAVVVQAEDAVAFVVTAPNSAMAWTLTAEPVWTEPFATLALSYFVEGIPAGGTGVFIDLFDGSTGPITPGATNTENPLASGGRHACGTLTPGLHVELVDLSQAQNLDRVAEITITVRSGAEPVAVRLNQMAFLAKPVPAGAASVLFEPPGDKSPPYSPLALPAGPSVSLGALESAHGFAPGSIPRGVTLAGGLPFTTGESAVLTPLSNGASLSVDAGGEGRVLGLLCATRLWGSSQAWYSAGPTAPRAGAPQAHPFRVVLHYAGGSIAVAQPQASPGGPPGLRAGLAAYRVALEPGQTLAKVTFVEDMSYGQVALLAASIVGATPEAQAAPASAVQMDAPARAYTPAAGDLLLETANLRLVMGQNGLVHSLQAGEARRELATAPFELVTLIQPGGAAYPLAFVEAVHASQSDRLVVHWNVGEAQYQLELSLEVREDGGLVCTPSLVNLSDTAWAPWAVMPRLSGLRVSRGGATEYILGARSAVQDTAPIDMAEIYGGQFPLQFMDAYDQQHGGGLAYMVLDDTLTRKWFEFKQDDAGLVTMAVSYRNLSIAPGERRVLPPAVLLPHEGDWRSPFQQYRSWVARRFPRTRPNGMKDLFYCRRDYPLGGTTCLYDPARRAYTFDRLISESRWAFGGVDMVDISGWAYNEQIGRVGTYLQNDLGGLEALSQGVTAAHGEGVQVGLYFEGYLLDKRAANAGRGLAEWQLIRAENKPAWWGGEMEFFCCPGAKGWQDTLAADIAEVARVTGADAVYVDQLGILDPGKECWATTHGHVVPSNPIVEEIALLKRVREDLDKVRPACAIYIEHMPCDAMTPYIDGAFNMGMKHTRHALGPTKLPLHRYLYPDVPVFEMVAHGIRPIPAEEDDLKLSFFHGMGLWLKGKGASWYSQGFRQLAPKYHEVLMQYKDYFRSQDALPHVDTLSPGVFANKFSHAGNAVYTIYNANPVTVTGPLLKLDHAAVVKSLLDIASFGVSYDAASGAVLGSLPPQGVAAVLVSH